MRTVCLMLVWLACVLSPAQAQEGVRWVDASTLELQGRGFDDAAGYQRLPERFRERIPERVWELSTNSAGLVVRFATDAAEVRARWTTGPLLMNNLSPLAVRGLEPCVAPTAGVARRAPAGERGGGRAAAITGGRSHVCMGRMRCRPVGGNVAAH